MNTNTERYELNKQLAQMLKGGVIMDVTNTGAGKDRRRSRRMCGYGFRAYSCRYPRSRRRIPYE
mgnify:CR=1 FL=1